MTLSKQLYAIIFSIFLIIFAGNFIISVNNFKNYIETESSIKVQDTANLLGMNLKLLIEDKYDPEIISTIRAIANSGFYKEIRLENSEFTFTKNELFKQNNFDNSYVLKEIKIQSKDGEILSSNDDLDLESELLALENIQVQQKTKKNIVYSFIPSKSFTSDALNMVVTVSKDRREKKINLKMNVDKILVKVTKEEKFDSVPQFFIDLLPIQMNEAKSEISNGWKTDAVLYVSANAGEAYLKLYEQAKITIYYSIISFVFSFIAIIIFLRLILKPLKQIENLAIEVSNGNFKSIEKLPITTELKNVSIAMNNMSEKIEHIITNLNIKVNKITDKLSRDELTGLHIEQTFKSDMEHLLIQKESGYIISIKIEDLAIFNNENTNEIVDRFIIEFTQILKNIDKKAKVYRFYGSTFAVIIQDIKEDKILTINKTLKSEFNALGTKYKKIDVAYGGSVYFDELSDLDSVMSHANDALEFAKQIAYNEVHLDTNQKNTLSKHDWKDFVYDVVKNDNFSVNYVNETLNISKNNTMMKEAFINVVETNGANIQVGTFISMAQKYEKIIEIDKKVILNVIDYVTRNEVTYNIIINLSFNSMMDIKFNSWLYETLSKSGAISSKLVFSMTAYGCTRDVEGFQKFISLVHKAGAKVMVKRFDIKFILLENLKNFHLDYIRLSRDYTSEISSNFVQQTFLESICEISKLLNIKIIAENVVNKKDFDYLSKTGIVGVSG